MENFREISTDVPFLLAQNLLFELCPLSLLSCHLDLVICH